MFDTQIQVFFEKKMEIKCVLNIILMHSSYLDVSYFSFWIFSFNFALDAQVNCIDMPF